MSLEGLGLRGEKRETDLLPAPNFSHGEPLQEVWDQDAEANKAIILMHYCTMGVLMQLKIMVEDHC